MTSAELINEIIQKKAKIEEFKAEHPEMAEFIQLTDEYIALYVELVVAPSYPVCPSIPNVWPYWYTGISTFANPPNTATNTVCSANSWPVNLPYIGS